MNLFPTRQPPVSAISNRRYLSNVNTCVYEPPACRVLATCPRAPMYLPVPPKTGRTTAWPASNSGADGE